MADTPVRRPSVLHHPFASHHRALLINNRYELLFIKLIVHQAREAIVVSGNPDEWTCLLRIWFLAEDIARKLNKPFFVWVLRLLRWFAIVETHRHPDDVYGLIDMVVNVHPNNQLRFKELVVWGIETVRGRLFTLRLTEG